MQTGGHDHLSGGDTQKNSSSLLQVPCSGKSRSIHLLCSKYRVVGNPEVFRTLDLLQASMLGCFRPQCWAASGLNAGLLQSFMLGCFRPQCLACFRPQSWAASGLNAGLLQATMLGCFRPQCWAASGLYAGLLQASMMACFMPLCWAASGLRRRGT